MEQAQPSDTVVLTSIFADALNAGRPMVVDFATADNRVYTVEYHPIDGMTFKDYADQVETGRLGGEPIAAMRVEADASVVFEFGDVGGLRTAPVREIAQRLDGGVQQPVNLEADLYARMAQRMVMGTPSSAQELDGPSL